MKLLDLIICAGNTRCIPFRTDSFWCHPAVNASLIWAIVVLLLGVILLFMILVFQCIKYKSKKDMAASEHQHELNLKEKNHLHEQFWHVEKNKKLENDQIESLKKEIESLKNEDKVKKYETDLKLKDTEISLLKKQLELYQNAIKELKVELQSPKKD